jgi:hypothetical protein
MAKRPLPKKTVPDRRPDRRATGILQMSSRPQNQN